MNSKRQPRHGNNVAPRSALVLSYPESDSNPYSAANVGWRQEEQARQAIEAELRQRELRNPSLQPPELMSAQGAENARKISAIPDWKDTAICGE